jgi:hypothetical protein
MAKLWAKPLTREEGKGKGRILAMRCTTMAGKRNWLIGSPPQWHKLMISSTQTENWHKEQKVAMTLLNVPDDPTIHEYRNGRFYVCKGEAEMDPLVGTEYLWGRKRVFTEPIPKRHDDLPTFLWGESDKEESDEEKEEAEEEADEVEEEEVEEEENEEGKEERVEEESEEEVEEEEDSEDDENSVDRKQEAGQEEPMEEKEEEEQAEDPIAEHGPFGPRGRHFHDGSGRYACYICSKNEGWRSSCDED